MMNYSQNLQEIKKWAQNLLIMQYRRSSKNQRLIEILVNLVCANNLAAQIRDLCMNLDESFGAQLDVIGKWVGIDRFDNATDSWTQPYFALVNYSNIQDDSYDQWQGGMSSYTDFDDNDGGFLTYQTWRDTRLHVNQLGDSAFRSLIKLKIIKNSIAFTNKNIDDAVWEWSNNQVYTTWGTMTVTYHYPASMRKIMQLAVFKDVLLAPTGCTILTEEY